MGSGSNEGTPRATRDELSYTNKLQDIIGGVGFSGCGYEAPLEAFYRFLVEPTPHALVTVQNGTAVLTGVDQTVLDQRAAFLRPDSAVLIVVVTDEDDCSIIDGGQNYLAAQLAAGGVPFQLPRARSECEDGSRRSLLRVVRRADTGGMRRRPHLRPRAAGPCI